MVNLLTTRAIRFGLPDGIVLATLPETLAALSRDDVISFPALRSHQRHPWHAFLVQSGAIACIRVGLTQPPTQAEEWARILRALTPDYPDDEPWCLVSPPDKPAFLQPVVGPLAELKSEIATPDALDMLVTSKDHDLKAERMFRAEPDDWLFALVALQTSQGFLGAGNYGASRMNGGFANRPGLSLAPKGGVGKHVMRDISRLIALRDKILDENPLYDPNGPALLWLLPWDGTQSLPRKGLDPYYIEVCRRVRLIESDGRIAARGVGSKVARIAMSKEEGGITGDPWTPIDTRTNEHKALTIDARGFDYRRLSGILFGEGYGGAPLQVPAEDETGNGWTLICRALARGQGKTEGYHERRVSVPATISGRLRSGELRRNLGVLAQGRIGDASAARGALRFGLMTLFQNGPGTFSPLDPSSSRHSDPFLDRFQAEVDRDFFEALFEEALADSAIVAEAVRRDWLLTLLGRAETLLHEAEAGSPGSAMRRHRALVKAEDALRRGFFGSKILKTRLRRNEDAA